MSLSLIAAMSRSRVLGYEGQLPWHLPDDLKRFKQLTMGHHVIMGRKTWDTVGKPLPGRTNVVVTRNAGFAAEGVLVASSIDEALELARGDDEPFVAGGGEIYAQTIDRADRIYLTVVDGDFVGDAYFPEVDLDVWRESFHRAHPADERHRWAFAFIDYVRLRG